MTPSPHTGCARRLAVLVLLTLTCSSCSSLTAHREQQTSPVPPVSKSAVCAEGVPASSATPTLAAETRINPADGSVLVHVPAGSFTMGSDQGEADERPVHTVSLGGYWIGRAMITNRQFARFLTARGNRWQHDLPWYRSSRSGRHGILRVRGGYEATPGLEERPVTGVSWDGARAYCSWAGLRLPTEPEFEKAARGTQGRVWPWGDRFDARNLNCLPESPDGLSPALPGGLASVGSYPSGASPYGCLDMAGNAWAWCSSLYATYPYRADDGRECLDSDGPRVVRGGSFRHTAFYARTTNRYRVHWYYASGHDKGVALTAGVRVAQSDPPVASEGKLAPSRLLDRVAHPPMAPYAASVPRVSAQGLDERYRLKPDTSYPPCQILGYPPDDERERLYLMARERLDDLLYSDRDSNTQPARVLAPLHLRHGAAVAELGTGSGYFTRILGRLVGDQGEVWGTDISISSLQYVQRRATSEPGWPHPQRLWLVLHDCTDCLLPPRHFDAILMSQTHYFVYPRARRGASPTREAVQSFYRSVARSLKPGGVFVVHEHSDRHLDQDPERGVISADEIAAQLLEAGLLLVQHQVLSNDHANDVHEQNTKARDLLVFRAAHGASR